MRQKVQRPKIICWLPIGGDAGWNGVAMIEFLRKIFDSEFMPRGPSTAGAAGYNLARSCL